MPPTRRSGLIALASLITLGIIMSHWAYPRLQDEVSEGCPTREEEPTKYMKSEPPAPNRIFSWPIRLGAPAKQADRALILFTYAESEASRANLLFFLRHGLHGAADFVFVFNGDTDAAALVPSRENVKIVKRDATCFDLGAAGQVLREGDLWKRYRKFILMNASLRGPFLPSWTDSCWSDLFLSKVTDKVKLVGITANCSPRFYLPSMILATDKVGMSLLLDPQAALAASTPDKYGGADDPVGLSGCYDSWEKAVHAEMGMTSIILNGGYGVDVMMSGFHRGVGHKAYCDMSQGVGDVLNPGGYFGSNVHPYETVFINPSRGITPVLVDNLGQWMAEDGYSSEDRCEAQKHK
ncbi:hypothetical protein CTA1_1249 [Colletotrichum tanaceti]|uniref:Uncharacterized protein n=1 Tax=Colletotrichum tanaceti TaxID=1306861 RepID=A0A4U6XHI3_9PEZI|nr:hypothetical protein CTA1_1249 [Colletotrichum tanaceti]